MILKGSITALITPFKNGKVDEAKLKELIDFQIQNGTSALVPCGTTGESSTLNYEEHNRVIDITVQYTKKRIPVIAGTGSNSTDETIMLTKHAKEAGADACLLVAPYYNRPTQDGLIKHFLTVADTVDIPLVLYNIPGRTGVNIEPETIAKLSAHENIIAVKEASGSLDQMSKIISLCNIILLSGDDSLTLPVLSIGGTGVISVASNIVPKDVADMVTAYEKGDIAKAKRIHYKLYPLFKALFIETNPAPLKSAMHLLGMIEDELRLPLVSVKEETRKKLQTALKECGLLK